MSRALGIVNFAANNIWVDGLSEYRPIGAFSFLGRYRIIDFPLSNLSNSGIDQIQVYVRRKARSLAEHLGTGRHYNINSKRGKVHLLFSETEVLDDMYNTDISAFLDNMEIIERIHCPYVVIAPSYMVYTMNFDSLLQTHIDSGAEVTLLYHAVDNAKEHFLFCDTLNLNKQKGVPVSYTHLDVYKRQPLNTRNTKDTKILPVGVPVCEAGLAMNRDGKCYDQNRIKQKFCCPCKLSGTCPVEHPKFFNGKKNRGCTKYITIPNDLRLSIDRNSRYFKNNYSLRTECERYNSRFKNTGQERMWVRNKSSVANLNTLAHISLLAVAVAAITNHEGQSYRKLKAIKRTA